MSKTEGDILKGYLKANGIGISKFSKDMGYSDRQGLYFQLSKDPLDHDFKIKAAQILGVTPEDIFSQKSKHDKEEDLEKSTLRELVSAQKDIIKYQKEFITAQLIRQEAFQSIILARIAGIEVTVDPEKHDRGLEAVLDEATLDVEEKIKELGRQLGLNV
ncbi:MAG TPA: hypothetical protein VEV15_13575 [Flavisolibacter sp.]|nr:hypothetical protein [Flavisolibacter sp.]